MITEISRETELGWEGCGSIPSIFAQVERYSEVTVAYRDQNGEMHSLHCVGLLARIKQHGVDHSNGVLFTDIADPRSFVSREYYAEHIRGVK